MFIDRLIGQGNVPLLERMVRFTSARHEVLAENIVNVSTPNYQQKDVSLPAFQKSLRARMDLRSKSPPGSVKFDDIDPAIENPRSGLLFHDRNNRSMEHLMTDLSSNALKHNLYTELLRKQFNSLETVLKERIA
jgi:flagellar basal-body rod protein FlgB